MFDITAQSRYVVGKKQTLKALANDEALKVILAKDSATEIKTEVTRACNGKNVLIEFIDTMEQLGQTCDISRNAAVACILKQTEGEQ